MTEYEFRCQRCHKVFTEMFDPSAEKRASCPQCGEQGVRIYGATLGHIDWVNGGFHGGEINMGLGKYFRSAAEREDYAKSKGLVKA